MIFIVDNLKLKKKLMH